VSQCEFGAFGGGTVGEDLTGDDAIALID